MTLRMMQIKSWNENRLDAKIETVPERRERYHVRRPSRHGQVHSRAAGNIREKVREEKRR